MIDQNTKFYKPKNEQQATFQRWFNKFKKTASRFRIIPSHEYNPQPKPMSRRDRIRARLQKRDGTTI